MASKRRGNREGSIRQRADGRWEAQISLGSGQRRSLYGKTRQEVAAKLASALRDHARGLPVARDERQTVGAYLQSWLDTMRPPRTEATTWERRETYVRLHITPTLGATRLVHLSAQQVQALYAAKLADGRLSATTVRHIHATLHVALQAALRLGLVPRNVTDLVEKPRAARQEMHVWTPAQARTFLATTEGTRNHALWALALSTGMRQGELLALRWRDVNLDHAALSVTASLQRPKTGLVLKASPKTRTSRRRIVLAPQVVMALRTHHTVQQAEQVRAGAAWQDGDFVFCNEIGGAYHHANLDRYQFKPLIRRAGLDVIRFHDLRHTAATTLLAQGVNPKIVSEMLGHASVGITLDLYSHVLPSMQQQAAEAMATALWG
jgi:integrase